MRADSLLEVSQRAQFDIQLASQWLNLRLQLIGLAMLAGVAILALLQHHFDAIDAGNSVTSHVWLYNQQIKISCSC